MRIILLLIAAVMASSFTSNLSHPNYQIESHKKKSKKTDVIVNYSSTSIDYFSIQFFNISTSQTFYFSASPNTSGILGTIPEGSYNVTFGPSDPLKWHSYVVSCGYYMAAKGTHVFTNVLYDDICNYMILSDY